MSGQGAVVEDFFLYLYMNVVLLIQIILLLEIIIFIIIMILQKVLNILIVILPPMHSSNIMINGGSPNFVNWNSATINPLDFRISQNSNARNRGGALNILEMENSILSEPDMNGFSVGNYLGSGENLATYYAKRDFNGNLRGVDGSWDIGAFEYVSGVQCAPVDNDCNGCVSLSEISSFVARWLNGEISLSDVSGAVSLWLNGGC
ncbi:MAG: hypothetical protein KatS3mg002_0140 [Candidatus Woesearchaeota archaeon]|nr:MAG: hypothetical protein KatS3mg002_0140 [Candidatus Woesearchaeota archaeon]